ncbi:acetate--CoA ligase family protein [Advenella kashmirensis]|uniref:acetate--CoA ligase family protein n=1 Tax=Advenella kashmirensis TaxID=310575 RepID=UPI00209FE87C|nr:acetate--CoA ligase family protein [Advenella kashmirensis]
MSHVQMDVHPLNHLFNPDSVAIIGASSDPGKLGGRPIRFLLEAGYEGAIYPINKRADTVQGLKAYPSLADIPGKVDQAIIIVPAPAALAALQECIAKNIKMVQILSSGFSEENAEGLARQQALVELAAQHGVRLLGPNCLGIVSVRNRYFATFSTALEALTPQPGGISFATQSGAFGSCAYAQAIQRGLGIARIVATGNEADIDVTECIDFLASDPQTRVICAAIEGCRDGNRLRRALLKAAAANKPVILMKVGTSETGQQAVATHTGAIAGNDRIFDVVCQECGAWRAMSIEEMLDIAYVCTQLPLPTNDRASITTVSGGIGVLMADDAERFGITIAPVSPDLQRKIHEVVPFLVGVNPLDTTAQIGVIEKGFQKVLDLVIQDTDYAIHFVYLAQIPCDPGRFLPLLEDLTRFRKQYPERLIVLVGPSDERMRALLEQQDLVIFSDPGRAVRAVAALCAIKRRWQSLHPGLPNTSRPGKSKPDEDSRTLNELQAKRLLARYGLAVPAETLCTTASEAVDAADAIGYPVVAKIVSPDILHKSDFGGVQLNLQNCGQVEAAFAALMNAAAKQDGNPLIQGVLIAPMIKGGIETILGVHHDPIFGSMVMFGLGGVAVELYNDVAFASVPLTAERAEQLIHSVRASKLLTGWRGQKAVDLEQLKGALLGLSAFAEDWSDVLEGVDINPFVVMESGTACLDAVISVR